MLELYHDWRSFCSIKVRLCLAEKGLAWESREVDLMALEHTRPEYLKLNPNGVVPTLVHDGAPIIESTIINEYIDEVFPDPPLLPQDPVSRARARAWVKFEDDVLHPVIRPATFNLLMAPLLARLPDDELEALVARHPDRSRAEQYRAAARSPLDVVAIEAARTAMEAALDKMERRLSGVPWLGGETYSLADVAAAPFVDRLEEMSFAGLWSDRPAVNSWIGRLKSRPAYQTAIPAAAQRFPALARGQTRGSDPVRGY